MAKKTKEETIDYSWVSDFWRPELLSRAQTVNKLIREVLDNLERDDIIGFYTYLVLLDHGVRDMADAADRGIKSASPRNKVTQIKRLILRAWGKK